MKAVSCHDGTLESVDLPDPEPGYGDFMRSEDALADPDAHAKILIDPRSAATEPARPTPAA